MDVENGDYLQGLLSLYRVSGKLMENTDIGIVVLLQYGLSPFTLNPF